jgi:hypothetical protein
MKSNGGVLTGHEEEGAGACGFFCFTFLMFHKFSISFLKLPKLSIMYYRGIFFTQKMFY